MTRMRFDWNEDMQRLGDRFDDYFDRLFDLALVPRNSFHQVWRPAVDVIEIEDGVVILAELAGVSEADLNVTIEGGRLRISGIRRPQQVDNCKGPLQLEIEYGPFERVVAVPPNVDTERLVARFRDGMLSVCVPARSDKRTIPIAVEGEEKS